MSKKMLLIMNPFSGKMQCRNYLFDMVDIFSKDDYEVTVCPTKKRFDATELTIKKGNEYDLIACCGGDGTLNEVITGAMSIENAPPIGYIPSGTTNDLATSLKMPKNMVDAALNVVQGVPFLYDIGTFNNQYFAYIAAFGAFTEVSYQTSQQVKNSLGHLAYILEGIRRLTEIKAYHLIIEHDGGTVEGDYIFGSITNSTSVAGLLTLDKEKVRLNDGLFELLLIKSPKNIIELNGIITGLLTQNYDHNYISLFHSSKVKIYSEVEIPWTLDGENGGRHTNVDIVNNPRSVTLMVSEEVAEG